MLYELISQIVGFFVRNGASALATGGLAVLIQPSGFPVTEGNVYSAIKTVADNSISLVTGEAYGGASSYFTNGVVFSLLVNPLADLFRRVTMMTTVSQAAGSSQYASFVSHGLITAGAFYAVAKLQTSSEVSISYQTTAKWAACVLGGDYIGGGLADASSLGVDYI